MMMIDKNQNCALKNILNGINNYGDILLRHREIIAAWKNEDTSSLTAEDIKTPLYSAMFVDTNKLDEEMSENVETIRHLFLIHWLDNTRWTTANFWEELGAVFASMQVRRHSSYKSISSKLAPFVADNREALEEALFASPGYSKLKRQQASLNTDFSIIVQDFSWNTFKTPHYLEWSDSFLRDLYSGEDLSHMRVVWADFLLMPEHLRIEFTMDALKNRAYPQASINNAWCDAKTTNAETKLQLATVAAIYEYDEAYAFLEKTQPSIIKQIQLGRDLGLTQEEIVSSLKIQEVSRSALPDGLDIVSATF